MLRISLRNRMKFSIKDFFQREQIRRKLQIYGGFVKKYLTGNLNFCVVLVLVKSLFNLNKRDATPAELRP